MKYKDSYYDGIPENIKKMSTDELNKAITAEEMRIAEINKQNN